MDISILLLIGIPTCLITIAVHKHTYRAEYNSDAGAYQADLTDRVPFPRWLAFAFVVINMIPIVNMAAFIVGNLFWWIAYASHDIRLGNLPNWIKAIERFWTKDINK